MEPVNRRGEKSGRPVEEMLAVARGRGERLRRRRLRQRVAAAVGVCGVLAVSAFQVVPRLTGGPPTNIRTVGDPGEGEIGAEPSPSSSVPTGRTCIISFLDAIRVDGITYGAQERGHGGRSITEADLGPVVERVKRTLDEVYDCNRPTGEADGDAPYAKVGEPIYALKGYDPRFRLAMRSSFELQIYEAGDNRAAKKGGDVLDLEGKVERIQIKDRVDDPPLAEIADPREVERLVSYVLAAPIDRTLDPNWGEEPVYTIVFRFTDGTATARSYWSTRGVLWPWISLPPEFREAVQAALAP